MLEIGGVCQRKFYFNLLHWAWTAEPDRGSHAESLASAAAGSGYAKLIFKPTAVYSWIFNLAIFHFIVTTIFNMEVSPPDLQYSSWRTTVRKTVQVEDKLLYSTRYKICNIMNIQRPRKGLSSSDTQMPKERLLNFRFLVFNL